MASEVEHVITKDGSSTLYAPRFNQHYHSLHGAIQESLHVFIEMGLKKRLESTPSSLKILEMGLGTGLNALLTALAVPHVPVFYLALEAYPISETAVEQLNYPQEIQGQNQDLFQHIHKAPWEEDFHLSANFSLYKKQVHLQDFQPVQHFDLINFDAFAPESQPELWTPSIFEKIYEWCESQAIFVTYSAKGDVRRALKNAGFSVEKIPGPPGKREMLRASKS